MGAIFDRVASALHMNSCEEELWIVDGHTQFMGFPVRHMVGPFPDRETAERCAQKYGGTIHLLHTPPYEEEDNNDENDERVQNE